jgi:hypothetical protein
LRPSAFSLSFYFTRFWKLDGRGYVYWFEGDERFWHLTSEFAEGFSKASCGFIFELSLRGRFVLKTAIAGEGKAPAAARGFSDRRPILNSRSDFAIEHRVG